MAPAASKAIRDQLKKLRFHVLDLSEGHRIYTSELTWARVGKYCLEDYYGPETYLWLAGCGENPPPNLPRLLNAVEGVAPLPNLSATAPIFSRDLLPKVRRERRCALLRSVRVRKR